MRQLKLTLLGGFAAQLNDRQTTKFRSQKARALLAYLVLEAGRPQERATLAALFWPERPDALALGNLSQTLVWLRRTLGDGGVGADAGVGADVRGKRGTDCAAEDVPFLLLTRRQVQWNGDAAADVDVLRFLALVDRSGTPGTASIEALGAAVALYQGEFLAGFDLANCPAFDEWLLLQREYLQRLALEALSRLAEHSLANGAYGVAATLARRQLAMDHWREEAMRQLLSALAADGRRAEALAEYEKACHLLRTELGVEPQQETAQLAEAIREESGEWRVVSDEWREPSSRHSPPATFHNLPARLTSLLGRRKELAQLREWLIESGGRLVTISGAGGVGKTRLALATAAQLLEEARPSFPDGIWYIPLAGLDGEGPGVATRPAGFLASAIAATLGLTISGAEGEQAQLQRALAQRRLLLVLDNFEHLLTDADDQDRYLSSSRTLLVSLLHHAPGVHALVTSRERLNIAGERVLALEGLPVPDFGLMDAAELLNYSSARLFFDRAMEQGIHLNLDEGERQGLIRICQLADGLPLVIELAAAWAGHFTCVEIAQEMSASLDFLAAESANFPARQRSPRAAFDYSWGLLSTAEQQTLAQLALLRGHFPRAAALAVGDTKMVNLLSLVNKSLLRQIAPGWYTLHELIRHFALERLVGMGKVAAVEARHAAFFLRFVAERETALPGASSRAARAEIRAVLENVRVAWQWAVNNVAMNNGEMGDEASGDEASGDEASGDEASGDGRWGVHNSQFTIYNSQLTLLDQSLFALAQYYCAEGVLQEGREALGMLVAALNAAVAQAQDLPNRVTGGSAVPRLLSRALAWQALIQRLAAFRYEETVRLAETAVEWARLAGDPLTQGLAFFAQGTALTRPTENVLARSKELTSANERILDCMDRATMFSRMVLQGDSTAADDIERYRARLLEADSLIGPLSQLLHSGAAWSTVKSRYEQAIALCRALGHLQSEAQALRIMAERLEAEGSLEEALDYRWQEYEIHQQMGSPEMESASLNNLAGTLTFLGEYEQALQLGRAGLEITRRRGRFSVPLYHSVGLALFYMGDYAAALALAQQGVEHRGLVYFVQLLAGESLTRLGRWREASVALQAAYDEAQQRENRPMAAVVQSAMAALALARGETAVALALVEPVLPVLYGNQIHNWLEPLRVCWQCYEVLCAAGDARAADLLAMAYDQLQAQATRLHDERLRHSFLHRVAANRAIVGERERDEG